MRKTRISLAILASVSLQVTGVTGLLAQGTGETSQPAKVPAHQTGKGKTELKYQIQEPQKDESLPERTRLHRPGEPGETPQAGPKPEPAPNLAGNLPPPSPAPMPMYSAPPVAPPAERFPTVGQLEKMMFGNSSPGIAVEGRLDRLENAVFQKNFANLDTESRIHKLKEVLIGPGTQSPGGQQTPQTAPSYAPGYDPSYGQPAQNTNQTPYQSPAPYANDYRPQVNRQDDGDSSVPFFENQGRYNLEAELPLGELEKFALLVVNDARTSRGLQPVEWDELAYKIASEHADDLATREVVSHHNQKGENPDVRYTRAGGANAMDECLILFPQAKNLKPTRDLVAKMLETLAKRQDDRDALLAPHATGFGMAFRWTKDRSKLICCNELITDHANMEPLPVEAAVGDKIDVKGNIEGPYQFLKITLAWEGDQPALDDSEESSEPLPYFPPLDYEAYAAKSEHDWDKGIRVLQIAGITAAIAGGFFMPPVALAAPLIAASAGVPKVKPVSDIPIKGGVKTDGQSFSHKVGINHEGKDGIYYITVWAKPHDSDQYVPVSRRAIIARGTGKQTSEPQVNLFAEPDPQVAASGDKKEKKKKAPKKKKGKELESTTGNGTDGGTSSGN